MVSKKKSEEVVFPKKVLSPIKTHLEKELMEKKKMVRKIQASDPFLDSERTKENSVEEDVDEQIDHLSHEVRAGFVKKQLVQLRKALTMLKIGRYGKCEKCGKMIDTDRLAVRPETTICLKCEKERDF
ncbi:MAG: TraR/DksA C4-type zinc finger protein [Candidatus Shapirobacteria bacterium]